MKLSDYLKANGLTDAAFAEIIGVDRSSVTRMRAGGQIPSAPVMQEIAKKTNGEVTANDFFDINPSEAAA